MDGDPFGFPFRASFGMSSVLESFCGFLFFFRYSFFLITFVSPLDIYQYMMGVNTNRGKRVTLGEDSQAGDG